MTEPIGLIFHTEMVPIKHRCTCIFPFQYFTQFQDSVRYSDVTSEFAERFYLSNPLSREVQK